MAEFAQRSIEEMLVEVEKMRKVGLFSLDETRAIMKKRKRFEYKMQRRTKEKDVYLQYIQYEVGVYQLIRLRRTKTRIELGRDEIDKAVALRIYKLFRIACFRFKADIKIWLTHIDFAKSNMDKDRVSKLFATMLQVHNKKAALWIMAAKFELESNESVETARHLFQRALRFLPESRKLWLEYFKMELLCVEMIHKRRELLGIEDEEKEGEEVKEKTKETTTKQEDAILSCKIVEVVFRQAIKQVIKNVPELIAAFSLVASRFKFTTSLIEFMYACLSEDETLSQCEESVDVLARRHLLSEQEILAKCAENGQVADFTIIALEEKASAVYQQKTTAAENATPKMHSIYIAFCKERLELDSKYLNAERFARLNAAYKAAGDSLSLSSMVEWVDFLMRFGESKEETASVLDKALAVYSTSAQLWHLKLKMKIEENEKENSITAPEEIVDMFRKATAEVKPLKDAFVLWTRVVDWALLTNYAQLEPLLVEGSHTMDKQTGTYVRSKYLNWCLQQQQQQTTGLDKMREVYASLHQVPPYDVEFYLQYIEIEKCAPKPDEKRIVRAFEDALHHFGSKQTDIWLKYVTFETAFRKKSSTSTDNVAKLYRRAMKELDCELADSFTQEFALLKLSLSANVHLLLNDIEMD